MDSLRVSSGIKNIEVNDSGEYISIPVNDAAFFNRYAEVLKNFEQKEIEYGRRADGLKEKHKDKSEGSTDIIADIISLYADLCRDTCAELDRLFGEGSCRKIFPDVECPNEVLIGEFFEQITPLLNQYSKERNEKINLMYNRNRKGARSE